MENDFAQPRRYRSEDCDGCTGPDPEQTRRFQQALRAITGRWKIEIIGLLVEGPVRFGALKRALPGVTQHMLTAQLKDLVTSGMVIRRAYPEVPPKVEYELSQAGVDVLPILQDLLAWAAKHDASLALANVPARVVTRPDALGAERSR